MNPWSEDDEPAKQPTNWGCAVAAIIGSIAAVVAVVIVLIAANSLVRSMFENP